MLKEARMGAKRSCRQRGFTLVEQILVGAIVAVLACMTAPALGHLVVRNRLQLAQSDIIAALQQTRELAIQTGRRSMLCPTRDGRQCTDEVHWESGWLSGYYADRTEQLDGSPVLADRGHGQLHILSTAGRRRVRFQPDGSARGSNASFTVCLIGEPAGALLVRLSNAGRIYGTRPSAEQAHQCANGS
jgi:type IV fimbrial biogenesis protein FimT